MNYVPTSDLTKRRIGLLTALQTSSSQMALLPSTRSALVSSIRPGMVTRTVIEVKTDSAGRIDFTIRLEKNDVKVVGIRKAFEVYLGGRDSPYRERVARQELDTGGALRLGDLDGAMSVARLLESDPDYAGLHARLAHAVLENLH